MQEQTLFGVPFKHVSTHEIDENLKEEMEGQKTELEGLGVTVTGIQILSEESTPRFFITFPFGAASFSFRGKIEARGYDVGQQMGDKILKFYATRRAVKGTGWKV